MNKKNILVTGGAGFIGKHLMGALNKDTYSTYLLSRSLKHDICNEKSFDQFTDKEIDVVVHLAGETFVPESWRNPANFYLNNTIGTQRVLDFCKKVKAKLVYISAYIYGYPKYLPVDEKHPVIPNNPYAHSKWLSEELCKFYSNEIGVKCVILRPFNIYGDGQDGRHLIPFLIKQIKEKGCIEVKDDTPKRDYLYISDFIRACILAISHEGDFDIFNVGYGDSITVKDIIKTIIECYGKKIEWHSLGEKRKNEISETKADCRHIKDVLGWTPKVSFKDGVKDILAANLM